MRSIKSGGNVIAGIVVGEIIALEDQKEFVCFKKIQDGGKDYLSLVSNFKPVEVIFTEAYPAGHQRHDKERYL